MGLLQSLLSQFVEEFFLGGEDFGGSLLHREEFSLIIFRPAEFRGVALELKIFGQVVFKGPAINGFIIVVDCPQFHKLNVLRDVDACLFGEFPLGAG